MFARGVVSAVDCVPEGDRRKQYVVVEMRLSVIPGIWIDIVASLMQAERCADRVRVSRAGRTCVHSNHVSTRRRHKRVIEAMPGREHVF